MERWQSLVVRNMDRLWELSRGLAVGHRSNKTETETDKRVLLRRAGGIDRSIHMRMIEQIPFTGPFESTGD